MHIFSGRIFPQLKSQIILIGKGLRTASSQFIITKQIRKRGTIVKVSKITYNNLRPTKTKILKLPDIQYKVNFLMCLEKLKEGVKVGVKSKD